MDLLCSEDLLQENSPLPNASAHPDDVSFPFHKEAWAIIGSRERNQEALEALSCHDTRCLPRPDYLQTVQKAGVVDAYVRDCVVDYIVEVSPARNYFMMLFLIFINDCDGTAGSRTVIFLRLDDIACRQLL
jgi:hypothetical protein